MVWHFLRPMGCVLFFVGICIVVVVSIGAVAVIKGCNCVVKQRAILQTDFSHIHQAAWLSLGRAGVVVFS